MKMKQIKSFGIVLAGLLAIVGLTVSYSMMWPREKEVNCDNQDIFHPMQPSKFLGQIITLAFGLLAWLVMFYEVLCGSTKETAKKWKEKICPAILLITGLLVTAILAVVLGNASGRLSPDFLSACKPSEASWKEACSRSFSRTCRYPLTAKVKCTTDWRSWVPSRSSVFPRMISCLSYSMATWLLWMLWRPISSTRIPKYFILPVTIVFPWLIGLLALNESSADIWDVLSGYLIGAIIAWFMMWICLPALYPFIYESELPQHWNDGIPLQTLGKLGSNPDLKKPAADPAKPPLPIIR